MSHDQRVPSAGTGDGFEIERYELCESPRYHFELHRREFVKLLGGGLVVLIAAPSLVRAQDPGRRRGGRGARVPDDIAAWLKIGEDGRVTAATGKVEMGQGSRTSLTQAVAEELRLPPGAIDLVMADTQLTPFDMGTFGSRTTPSMLPQLRRAAAAMRAMLCDLAAQKWSVPAAEVAVVADGRIAHATSGRAATFAELARGQTLDRTIGDESTLTSAREWHVLGQSLPRVGGRELVTGRHQYTSDVMRPGMWFGKVLRPPSFGAQLGQCDTKAAAAMSGVVVVRDGDFIGVAAESATLAEHAVAAIAASWTPVAQPSSKALFELLKSDLAEGGGGGGGGGRGNTEHGSVTEGLAAADEKLEHTYTVAYIAHAPLEPRAAVAEWQGDRLTVWTGSQRPFGVRGEVAQAFRIDEDAVRVIVPDTGAGYGGKHSGEAAIEAARLARAAKRPVKRVWTREEEFTWAYFRPAGVIDVTSGVSEDGKLTAWEFHNYNSGGSGIETPYQVANRKIAFHASRSPLRQGSYRGLAATANHFARETHMDEIAVALGFDPLELRLRNLDDQRLRAVLTAAAERFGWGKRKPANGQGLGLAVGTEKGGYVATCAEVATSERGIKVTRLVTAFECGAIVNPDHLKSQVEGAVVMGLGGALFEAIEFEHGQITNPRFSQYRVPRFADMPVLETVLLDRRDLPSAGAGETPIVAVAPAIGNAIFAATGKRSRTLPLGFAS